mgnify:CR=1 FL=1
MVECPRCGVESTNLVKTWMMIGKPSRLGEMLQLTIGLYECTNCKKKFRGILGKEKISLKGMMQKIKVLEEMVMEAAKKRAELEEKVKSLEEEKACLLAEIEALKAIPELEAKVCALEDDIAKLKEEKKVLEEKAAPPAPTPPPAEVVPAEAPVAVPAEAPAPAEEKPCEEKPCAPAEAPTLAEEKPCEEKPCEEKPSE